MNDSSWKSQGVGQHCIAGIDRLIYHHNVYRDNIVMCLSQRYDSWYQASHCLQHFVETPVTFQAYFFQKMPKLSWQPLFGTLTYQFFAPVQCQKGSMHLPLKRLPPIPRRPPAFLWPNANATCGHKLIEQINTIHWLVAALKIFLHWHINLFLGWHWPQLSFSDRITGNIVGGTSNNFNIEPRHYQIFAIDSKIVGSFASVVLLTTGVPWKRFSRRMPKALIPSSVRSSNNGSKVNRLSNVTVDPAFTSHFSIKPSPTSTPWPRPVSGKSVSTPQYGSAWRRYPLDEMMHKILNPNLMGFFLINCFVPCFLYVIDKWTILFEIEIQFFK